MDKKKPKNTGTEEKGSLLSRMRKSIFAPGSIILHFMLLLLALDIVSINSKITHSGFITQISCQISPFLKLALAYVPHSFFDFVQNRCGQYSILAPFDEKVNFLVIFILKINITIVLALIIGFWIFVIPPSVLPRFLRELRQCELIKLDEKVKKNDGVEDFVCAAIPGLLLLFLICVFDFFDLRSAITGEGSFRISYADMECIILFLTLVGSIRLPCYYFFLNRLTCSRVKR